MNYLALLLLLGGCVATHVQGDCTRITTVSVVTACSDKGSATSVKIPPPSE